MSLSPPSPKEIFSSNLAKLECVITAEDESAVSGTQIIWKLNGQTVDGIEGNTRFENSVYSKLSTLFRSRADWEASTKVSCSAVKAGRTPVVQELYVHKGCELSARPHTNASHSH